MTGFITKNELAQNLVEEIESHVTLATVDKAGVVKPDGTTITVGTDGTISTVQSAGDFTPEEKVKLAGIAENANNYALPTATDTVLGGVKVDGVTITIDSDGVIEATASASPTVTLKNDTVEITTATEDQLDLPIVLTEFNPNSSSYTLFKNTTKVPKTEFTVEPVNAGDLTQGYKVVLGASAVPVPIGTFFEFEVNSIVVA